MNWLREADFEPLPGYRLVEPLGTGGFGEVWKCVAPGGIHKAIKFVYGNLNTLDDESAKAEQEFKAMERVKEVRHPFVLSMERIDVVGGELLIVMELADKSLYDVMQEYLRLGHAGIPRDTLLGYLSDSAEGLDHLIEKHALQHLDVKPKNLFLIGERVKVADFGLVKHLERQSGSGLLGGITPVYAAPETFSNKISKHSDQYSLAVLYVELLTGVRPFNGKNIRQLAMQHMAEAPNLAMLDDGDREAVGRALSKNPDERFPSCLAFVRKLAGRTMPDLRLTRPAPMPSARPATLADLDFGLSATTPAVNINTGPSHATPPSIPRHLLNRPDDSPSPRNPSMSMSVSFRPEEGVLRPAILIGVGSFGRRALQQVRCRLLDRVGVLSAMPSWRFLCLDVEPDNHPPSVTPLADASLSADQALQTGLQPVNAYRRRQLDQILEWLPREKLYAIPRSLRIDGSRALGRLAFCDHYLRIVTRLRNDLQIATHPESLSQSIDQSGLALRTQVPAVYVFASATGGSGGMLLDLGHAVRRTLERFHVGDAPVTAFVYAGAPEDPATPPAEAANVFATLTELHHFADPEVTFHAQYGGADGPKVEAQGLPFTATYLLPMPERTSEAFRDCVAHLAGYVTHDLTTPLGTGLEKVRRRKPATERTPFRSFGTFGVWYPRGLLVRSAARQASARLLRSWGAIGRVAWPAGVESLVQGVLNDPRLKPAQLQAFVATESVGPAGGDPVEAARNWVAGLAAEGARQSDAAQWVHSAWDAARDRLGQAPTTDADSTFRRGRVSRDLDFGIRQAVEAWRNELTELLRPLELVAGPRVAVAEAVASELIAACEQAARSMEKALDSEAILRAKARAEVGVALEACQATSAAGPLSTLAGRPARAVRHFRERLAAWAECRLREDLALAAAQFYRRLQTHFEGVKRDWSAARPRLAELAGRLEATVALSNHATTLNGSAEQALQDTDQVAHTVLQESNTMRVVLPRGEDHLDRSAADMLGQIDPTDLARLESVLTRLVVEPNGGLPEVAARGADPSANFANALVDQATAFLANLIPSEDVTAVELGAAGHDPAELARRVGSYVRAAVPQARGPLEDERTFVMVPDTEAGRVYSEAVRAAMPGTTTVPVRGTDTDLLFCREQGCLRSADLDRLLEPAWEAYQEALRTAENNPHARFDVTGWVPLVR